MSYQARFNFVGTPVIPKQKEDSKRPFCRELTKKDDSGKKRKMLSLSFGVKESDSNMAFVEAFDSEKDTIITFDSDNEKMEVDWDDRFDDDVISNVASYRKYTVDLGDDFGGRQEFITVYDMIEHLKTYLPEYKGNVVVNGQFTRDWYDKKKTYYSKFRIQNVYAVSEERKPRLGITADLFYNRDGFDDSDYDDTHKMTLDCYMEQYINKDEGRKYVPIQVVFSTAKYDLENNEKHKNLYKYKMKYIKVKNKNMVHMLWELVLLRGAEEAEFDESMLTDAQKEQIELGIKTLDDFKPKGNIFGDKIDEFRLLNPKLDGDFEDGELLDADDDPDEFEDKIYQPPQDETIDEAKNNSKKSAAKKSTKKTKKDVDEDEDDPPFDEDTDDTDEDDLF